MDLALVAAVGPLGVRTVPGAEVSRCGAAVRCGWQERARHAGWLRLRDRKDSVSPMGYGSQGVGATESAAAGRGGQTTSCISEPPTTACGPVASRWHCGGRVR
jgi:hypothetical protein